MFKRVCMYACMYACIARPVWAQDIIDIDSALSNAQLSCGGISDQLVDLKRKVGIGAAASGVGVAAGTGAGIVGIMKAKQDRKIEEVNIIIASIKKQVEEEKNNKKFPDTLQFFRDSVIEQYAQKMLDGVQGDNADLSSAEAKSKKLGNVRTGMMAGAAASNVVSAVVTGQTNVRLNIHTLINDCISAVNELRTAKMQVAVAGGSGAQGVNIQAIDEIISACGEYASVDLSKIDKQATGAKVASLLGAGLGVSGAVTSGVANTDAIRNARNEDGSDSKTAKGLNITSNVLAFGTAGASGVATVLNATQVSAIKKVVAVADKCEGALLQ